MSSDMVSGGGMVIEGMATPKAKFPHVRRAGPFLFVSGTSARRPDNTVVGATRGPGGEWTLDVAAQTTAVLDKIESILQGVGASLDDVAEITTFLVSMDDFEAYNAVWNARFPTGGPSRTTVAVRALPGPQLLIEMKAVAYRPVEA